MIVFKKHSVYDADIDKNKVIAYIMSEKTSEHVSKECALFVQSNTKVNGEWNLSFWFPIANNDVHKHERLLLLSAISSTLVFK